MFRNFFNLKQNHYAKTKRTSSFNLNGSSSYKCIKKIEQMVEIYCTIKLNKTKLGVLT